MGIRQGKIVPAQVTIDLLKEALGSSKVPHLVDGFPRSLDNLCAFEEQVCKCSMAIVLEVSEEAMEARLLERSKASGRADDNPETIKRRFKTFKNQSMPVIQALEQRGVLTHIDGSRSIEEVAVDFDNAWLAAGYAS